MSPCAALPITSGAADIQSEDANLLHQCDEPPEQMGEDPRASKYGVACKKKKETRKKVKKLRSKFKKLEAELLVALLDSQLLSRIEWDKSGTTDIRNLPDTANEQASIPEKSEVAGVPITTTAPITTQEVTAAASRVGDGNRGEPVVQNPRNDQFPRSTPSTLSKPSSSFDKRARSDSALEYGGSTAKRMRQETHVSTEPHTRRSCSTGAANFHLRCTQSTLSKGSVQQSARSANFTKRNLSSRLNKPQNSGECSNRNATAQYGSTAPSLIPEENCVLEQRRTETGELEGTRADDEAPQSSHAVSQRSTRDQNNNLDASKSRPAAPYDSNTEQQVEDTVHRDADNLAPIQELEQHETQYWGTLQELADHRDTFATQYNNFIDEHPNETVEHCKNTFGPIHLQKGMNISKKLSEAEEALKIARIKAKEAGVDDPNSCEQKSGFLSVVGEGEPNVKRQVE